MNRLCLFNGPPRSGKDTAVDYLQYEYSVYGIKFARPLHLAARDTVADLVGQTRMEYYAEKAKNETIPELGASYRQFCIQLSEDFYKPKFGKDIFGKMAAGRIREMIESYERYGAAVNFACSDSGFATEAKPVIEEIGVKNVMLIHLYRDGCSFEGDSRNYIDLSDFGIQPFTLYNTDLDTYYSKLDVVHEMLKAPCLPAPQVL